MVNLADRDWPSFLALARPKVDWSAVGLVLCLDPGETTGWALFDKGLLDSCGQWDTHGPSDLADEIHGIDGRQYLPDGTDITNMADPVRLIDHLIYETYRVRGNKFKEHVGSEVVTIQHIGAIKVVASELGLEPVGQSAGMAKGFATDAKLRRWGLYQANQRHANDSIRHGCYWHLFVAGRQ